MRAFARLCAVLLPVVSSAPWPVQSHPLVGEWTVTVPTGVRGPDGSPVMINRRGELVVKAVGDSLVATMTLDAVQSVPKQTRRLAGRLVTGDVTFTYQSEASLVGAGDALTRTATSTYVLTVKGDSLSGLISHEISGVPGLRDQQMSGARMPERRH